MEIRGFKCFHKGMINNYGQKFELGKLYIMPGAIEFGINGNGFHLCKRIEDTFRYFDALHLPVDVCEVIGSGEIVESFDDYYGYYDMYAVSELMLLRKLSREEIISIGLNLSDIRIKRFVEGLKLTEDEITMFLDRFAGNEFIKIEQEIDYYQRGNKDAFTKRR